MLIKPDKVMKVFFEENLYMVFTFFNVYVLKRVYRSSIFGSLMSKQEVFATSSCSRLDIGALMN